jgi:TPP-dependent pyruvate/acetoin dehydrogenase alpha subunit
MKIEGRASSAVHAAPAEKTEFSLIPQATLEALYANLLKDRMMDERLRRGKGEREAGWDAVKAAAAAVLMDTDGDDVAATADAMPLVRLLRGEKAAAIVRDGRGAREAARAADAARSREAAQLLLHAAGAALANKTKKNGKVAVVFWRDGGLERWREALEMARTHTLPMIFVCPAGEDSRSERKKAVGLTPGTELPRIVVDGYDPVAVYRVAHESIDRARRDRGATLIECATFRLHGQRGGRGDAVANMERYLRGKGMLRRGMKKEIEEAFAAELKAKRKTRKKRSGA